MFVTEAATVGSAVTSSSDRDGCEREQVSGASGGTVRRLFGIFFGAGDGEAVDLGEATGAVSEAGSEAS